MSKTTSDKPTTAKASSLISKEKWKNLEVEMARPWVSVKFSYKGHEISIDRCRDGESKTLLAVYIDGVIKGAWCKQVKNLPDDAPSILPDVWCHKTVSRYKLKDITQIEKIYGKRRAKHEYPDLHEKLIWISPYFSKASVLCRQFKKLDGLFVTKADCLSTGSETTEQALS